MATVEIRGFTVIELMLFLSITGALFAALMVGASNTITQQRYRESVQNYSSFLQGQYEEVMNTRNDRDDNWRCDNGTISAESNGGEARGTTDCVLLGKAIQVLDNGKKLQTSVVIGTEPNDQATLSDIEALKAYSPKLSASFNTATSDVDWDSNLTTIENKPSTASFLILRSPVSGLIRVFTSLSPLPADLTSLITQNAAREIITNCVRGQSGLLPIESVTVDPKVAGPDGVIVN